MNIIKLIIVLSCFSLMACAKIQPLTKERAGQLGTNDEFNRHTCHVGGPGDSQEGGACSQDTPECDGIGGQC